LKTSDALAADGYTSDVWDLRMINPLQLDEVVESVRKTGRLCAIDGGWQTCGLAGEVIASVAESLPPSAWRSPPLRITLPNAPAPASRALEQVYYPRPDEIAARVRKLLPIDISPDAACDKG
jgi:acetoin:2,6-dichlorophenolindophenol oxidoreductase subunit beta